LVIYKFKKEGEETILTAHSFIQKTNDVEKNIKDYFDYINAMATKAHVEEKIIFIEIVDIYTMKQKKSKEAKLCQEEQKSDQQEKIINGLQIPQIEQKA